MQDGQLQATFGQLRAPGTDDDKRVVLTALRTALLHDPANYPILNHLLPHILSLQVCAFGSLFRGHAFD
jgi:hypothetical protein